MCVHNKGWQERNIILIQEHFFNKNKNIDMFLFSAKSYYFVSYNRTICSYKNLKSFLLSLFVLCIDFSINCCVHLFIRVHVLLILQGQLFISTVTFFHRAYFCTNFCFLFSNYKILFIYEKYYKSGILVPKSFKKDFFK